MARVEPLDAAHSNEATVFLTSWKQPFAFALWQAERPAFQPDMTTARGEK